jgi:isocitrate dehydrogenase (NAD+)
MNKVNPTAAILSSVLMLNHLGERDAARQVTAAVQWLLKEGKATTYDLGGSASTSEMADAVIARMDEERV